MRAVRWRSSACLVVMTALLLTQPAAAKRKDGAGGGPGGATGPVLAFSADKDGYLPGDRVQLSWASDGTRFCQASGDWEGKFATEGVFRTEPISGPATYHLKCTSRRGGVTGTVSVAMIADAPEPPPEPEPLPEPEPAPDPEPVPGPEPAPVPTVSLSAAHSETAAGGRTTLTWTSTDADACTAGGGWNGNLAAGGSEEVGPLYSDTTYTLSCTGAGGSAGAAVTVRVVPAPSVSLSSSRMLVAPGAEVTLTWSAVHASGCRASGGWTGDRGTSGSEQVGPLESTTTFTLNCEGIGGSALQMVSVSTLGEISVSWVAPDENVDGSTLTDLNSYRIYYGTESRIYSESLDVMDPTATTHVFSAPPGDYYVTMTALDADGNESVYANEIRRSVP